MTRRYDPADIPAAPDLRYESSLWLNGQLHIAGLDEAGRGAWAGPVSAGAVMLPPKPEIVDLLQNVRDSKEMSIAARTFWAEEIKTHALCWGVGYASSEEIDRLGIIAATRLAMMRALHSLPFDAQHLLIDALLLPNIALPQTALIKGDARSLSIAAASVLAKTARDALMTAYDAQYPQYGFARHKGYGTASHQAALQANGPCPIHRFCFEPIRQILGDSAVVQEGS
jgi:ribonuclease HII